MAKVPIEVFEQSIAEIAARMNLDGQPRAIVFHEKEGRHHAHCVWSRIDVNQMKAINRTRLPSVSTNATILVVSPPRERPMA